MIKELYGAYNVSSPHSSRFHNQSVEPFHGISLPRKGSAFLGAGIEFEHGTDSSAMAVDI